MAEILAKVAEIFSRKYYIQWVEILVIIAIVIFMAYISYSLNLFKKD